MSLGGWTDGASGSHGRASEFSSDFKYLLGTLTCQYSEVKPIEVVQETIIPSGVFKSIIKSQRQEKQFYLLNFRLKQKSIHCSCRFNMPSAARNSEFYILIHGY